METVRFYYNIHMNICAEESWVVAYLIENTDCEEETTIIQELRGRREFYGWFECEVSNTIYEQVGMYYGMV